MEILLGHNQIGYIDEEDIHILKYTWSLSYSKKTKSYIALTCIVNDNKKYYIKMHRMIMKVTDPKIQVDHLNHNTLDNRKSNLRLVTNQQNCFNSRVRSDSKTGIKNIQWISSTNKYRVKLNVNGKHMHYGVFEKLEDAISVRNKVLLELRGEYAYID